MNAPLPKSRLGRGLASLIGEPVQGQVALPPEGEQRLVPTADLKAGRLNPRKDFRDEELAELAESIRSKGLVQPIIVRPIPGGYEIVAGERRWRAALKAGLHTVPVIARDLTDKEVLELAIIENVQRADLNAIEEATGYRELVERFSYTQEELSDIIGKSRSHVANTLRLLKLPEAVQAMVQDGRLTAGHARALVGRDDAEALARRILDESLNVRQVEALVQDGSAAETETSGGGTRSVREKDADTRAFEKELSAVLGLKVEIKRGSGESGNLVIKFGNFDQLDYIRMRLAHGAGS
jgi:ParB family transcriptional regulator, chromosome partitioning protein